MKRLPIIMMLLFPLFASAQERLMLSDLQVFPAIVLPDPPPSIELTFNARRETLKEIRYLQVFVSNKKTKRKLDKIRVKVQVEDSVISIVNKKVRTILKSNQVQFQLSLDEKVRLAMTHISVRAIGKVAKSETLTFALTRPTIK